MGSSGTGWKTINFVDGMYSYDDLNDYTHQFMEQEGDKTGNNFNINLFFVVILQSRNRDK